MLGGVHSFIGIGTGGNVGAQSSTVVIRGLSTQSIRSLGPCKRAAGERWPVPFWGC